MKGEGAVAKPKTISDEIDLSKFIETQWKKKIVKLGHIPFVDEQVFFEACREHSLQEVASPEQEADGIRAYLEGRLQSENRDWLKLLPIHDEDISWKTYSDRVNRAFDGADWAIIYNNTHERSAALNKQVLGWFEPLIKEIGIPVGGYTVESFTGRYHETAFGIHRALGLQSFFQPVVGEKNFWIWKDRNEWGKDGRDLPPPFEEVQKGTHNAIIHALKPGDLFYWPDGYWHVAENKRNFAAALGVSLRYPASRNAVENSLYSRILDQLKQSTGPLASEPGDSFPYHGPRSYTALPASMVDAAHRMQELAQDLPELVEEWWLQRCSNYGAEGSAPAAAVGELQGDVSVRLSDNTMVLYREYKDSLKIASQGILWVCENSVAAVELMRRLADGQSARLQEFFDDFLPDDDAQSHHARREIREVIASMEKSAVVHVT